MFYHLHSLCFLSQSPVKGDLGLPLPSTHDPLWKKYQGMSPGSYCLLALDLDSLVSRAMETPFISSLACWGLNFPSRGGFSNPLFPQAWGLMKGDENIRGLWYQ